MLIKNITIKPTGTIVFLTVGTATKIVLVSSSAEVADRNIKRIVTTYAVQLEALEVSLRAAISVRTTE